MRFLRLLLMMEVVVGKEHFIGKTFTAPKERRGFFTETILRFVNPEGTFRILDVGCGTGKQLFDLAETFPNARLTGVDISEGNIQIAENTRKGLLFNERLNFIAADYMNFQADLFDIIISDSTLQHISVPTKDLFSKLSADLAPGGYLIFTMPCVCFYNSILSMVRRIFRLFRSPLTDAVILAGGKILHGKQISEQLLRERVLYMYLSHKHYSSKTLNRQLENSFALELVDEFSVPHTSLAQPKHRMNIFRKRFTAKDIESAQGPSGMVET